MHRITMMPSSSYKIKKYSNQNLARSRKIQIETFMKELKSVVMEEHELQERHHNYLKTFLSFSDFYHSDASNRINSFFVYLFSKIGKFSITTLVWESNFVVMEEREFDNRDITNFIALLAYSDSRVSHASNTVKIFYFDLSAKNRKFWLRFRVITIKSVVLKI